MKKWKKVLLYVLTVLLVMAGVCGYFLFLYPHEQDFVESYYKVQSDKLTSHLRIVQLSDLHLREFGENNCDLVARIRALKPDIIAITGDMNDKKSDDTHVVTDLCAQLVEIAPVYYVPGNHEWPKIVFEGSTLASDLEALGVHFLADKYETVTIGSNTLLIGGIAGLNVFVVLLVGIVAGAAITLAIGQVTALQLMGNMGSGVSDMFETILVTLLVSSLCGLIRAYGGFDALLAAIHKMFRGKRGGQVGIGLLVGLMDISTANNTVAIVMAGPIAKEIAAEYGISPKRSASLLDTFSCVFQGIIPYGAQLLSAAALANATVTSDALHTSPAAIVGGMWYCWILAAVGLLSIFVPFADGVCRKDPWNWEYGCAQSAVAAKKALLEKEAEDVSAQ